MQEGRDENGKFTAKNLHHLMRERIGRKLIYPTPELLAEKAIEYFDWADETSKGKYTSAGLRLYIGFTRQNYYKYKNDPAFNDTIDHIETLLEDFMEKKLHWGGSTQGAIFWLKNKAGWTDENTINQNTTITELKIEVDKTSPPLAESE